MPAHRAAVKWNNQWWREAVHRKKSALPPTENVRPTTRKDSSVADINTLDTNNVLPAPPYKTPAAAELKQARQALEKILTAATVLKASINVEFEDALTLESAQANITALVEEFYRATTRAVRSIG